MRENAVETKRSVSVRSQTRCRGRAFWNAPVARLAGVALSVVVVAALGGCVSETSESSEMRNRQDEALRDPFSYGPSSSAGNPTRRGGAPGLPQKEERTLKDDWDSFWNP